MESKIFSVERSVMVGTGEALFDHIADCLASFLHERNLQGENLPLGFTFSFPLVQEGLTVGRLAQWTKGFKCSSVEGRDVVELLKEAIRRRGDISIDVVAILNDTTGTLMSSAWREPKCRIGLILGTGTNACYLEDIKNIETINPDDFPGQEHMVINTEWGAFGDNGELEFVRTKWDLEVDRMSLNPGKQTFEKMISGMYMGELVRLVILDMMDEGLIFQNQNTNKLRNHGTFPTSFLSEVEADPVGEYGRSRTVLFSRCGGGQRGRPLRPEDRVRGCLQESRLHVCCRDHGAPQEDGLQGRHHCRGRLPVPSPPSLPQRYKEQGRSAHGDRLQVRPPSVRGRLWPRCCPGGCCAPEQKQSATKDER